MAEITVTREGVTHRNQYTRQPSSHKVKARIVPSRRGGIRISYTAPSGKGHTDFEIIVPSTSFKEITTAMLRASVNATEMIFLSAMLELKRNPPKDDEDL